MSLTDVYISVDVETDGTVPGDASIVQLGAVVAGVLEDGRLCVPGDKLCYRADLEPVPEFPGDPTTQLWLEKNYRPYQELTKAEPRAAMDGFKRWVEFVSTTYGGAKPVYVAYPLAFDWSFTHFYFEHFLGPREDPFGFSSALDVKSMYAVQAGCSIKKATKGKMPKRLTSVETTHTHNALDDALEQAELFANVWRWKGEK